MAALRIPRLLRRLRHDARGSYVIEFALLSLPMMTLLAGGVEIGYYAYAKAHVEGALRQVAREATTGTSTAEELDTLLKSKIDLLITPHVTIEKRSYTAFSDVNQPEPLVSDAEPLGGTPGTGDCYVDINNNDRWDEDRGAGGLGGAEDIIYYGVSVDYPMLFPAFGSTLGGTGGKMKVDAGSPTNAAIACSSNARAARVEDGSSQRCGGLRERGCRRHRGTSG